MMAAHTLGLEIPEEVPLTWGESCALSGSTRDGDEGFGMRIARFPIRGRGALSGHVLLPGRRLGFNGDPVPLTGHLGLTDVTADVVRFAITDEGEAEMERTRLPDGRFRAVTRARFLAHDAEHPPRGPGAHPVTIEAVFIARHVPVWVRPGRMETAGAVEAMIETPEGSFELKSRGKWHEQIGDRPRFGPAFTYMSIAGDTSYLLAGKNTRARYGFWEQAGETFAVTAFEIDPPADRRVFRVTLENGRVIEGEATVKRSHSVPIEGKRRPGTFVVVATSEGELTGIINDWQPDP
jgi:hypothetical protein